MKLFLGSISLLFVTSFAPFASAQTTWDNSVTNGPFTSSANWNSSVPTATSGAIFNPTTGVSLNINLASGTAQTLTVEGGGSVTLSNATNETLTIAGETPFGDSTTNNTIAGGSTLTLIGKGTSTGDFNFSDGITEVGNATGTGTLNITSGIVNFPTADDSSRLTIGGNGTGYANQSGSSVVNTNKTLIIGGSDISEGTTPGAGTGHGTYTLTNSASLVSGLVAIGANSYSGDTSTGSLILNNSSTFTVTASGDLQVGSIEITEGSSTPNHGVAGGSGTITQNDTSTVTLNGSATFGCFNGASSTNLSTGTYNLNGGNLIQANGGTIFGGATNAVGILNQANGTLTEDAGTQLAFGGTSGLTGATGAGTGIYNLSGGNANIYGELDLGKNTGSTGILNQTGGTLTGETGSTINIGVTGAGSYNLSGSSAVANFQGGLNVGGQAAVSNATGTGVVNQTGGSLTTTTLILGGASGTGTGTYNFDGGTLTFTSRVVVNATGTFNQNTSFPNLTAANPVTLNGGTYSLNAGTVDLEGNTGVQGSSGIYTTGEGQFNFGGGTLVTTTGWADTLGGKITGTSSFEVSNGATSSLSGNLSGNGTLDITGTNSALSGIVILSGTSNASGSSWGATLTRGVELDAQTVNSLSSNGSFVIGTGSVLQIGSTSAASDTFLGNISDIADMTGVAAQLELTGTNKLILAGVTNLQANSVTTIGAGGSLEVDQGTISNVNGSAGNAADTLDIGNGLSNETVTLLGTTATNLLPNVTVNSEATLLASGITGNVTNSGSLGTLGTVTNPSGLTLSGNLVSTNTLLINANGPSSDSFTANTAQLSGVVHVYGSGKYGNNITTIVTAAGGITIGGDHALNDSAGLVTSNLKGVLFASKLLPLSSGDTLLQLDTTQRTISEAVGLGLIPSVTSLTYNQAQVGNAFDSSIRANSLPLNTLTMLDSFANATPDSIPTLLDQLSPESLQFAREISIENSTLLAEDMNGVLSNLRAGYEGLDTHGLRVVDAGFDNSLGLSLGSMLAYNSPEFGVNHHSIFDSPDSETATSRGPLFGPENGFKGPRLSEFIVGNVVDADLGQNHAGPSKATYIAGNMAAGVSFRMTSGLSTGVLFDYNHTDAKTDANGSKTKVDSYSPGIYGTYSYKGFYVNGLFTVGVNEYSNTRNIPLLGRTATSSPSGLQYSTNFDFGYDFQAKNHPALVFGPDLGFTYTHLNVDAFHESGANTPSGNYDLAVNQQSVDSLRSQLGGHAVYQFRSGPVLFRPNISISWQHEFLDNSPGITSQFNGVAPFTIQDTSTVKDSALLGGGLTILLDTSMAVYLNYYADVDASDYFVQSFEGGFKANF